MMRVHFEGNSLLEIQSHMAEFLGLRAPERPANSTAVAEPEKPTKRGRPAKDKPETDLGGTMAPSAPAPAPAPAPIVDPFATAPITLPDPPTITADDVRSALKEL